LLIIDAPNIAQIGSDDIAGEWFVDSHLYHFSRRTLARLLEIAGFEIVAGADPRDRENLLFAARKRNEPMSSESRDFAEVDAALATITAYVTTRANALRAA
jgi:pyruvate/2-oxoglutarate/acetoin dehydrogenase E1 component